MKNIKARRSKDPDGREIVTVPLHGKGEATLYEKDFRFLLQLGLSTAWNKLPNGYVTASCYCAPGRSVQVARVLLNAGPQQRVRYIDGDLTNLRSGNLILLSGGSATRWDRDFVKPSKISGRVEYVEYEAA